MENNMFPQLRETNCQQAIFKSHVSLPDSMQYEIAVKWPLTLCLNYHCCRKSPSLRGKSTVNRQFSIAAIAMLVNSCEIARFFW